MRGDTQQRHRQYWFVRWLTGTASLAMIAARLKRTTRTIQRWLTHCWTQEPRPQPWTAPSRIVVLDGTSLVAREQVVLVAYGFGDQANIAWVFTVRETAAAWSALLVRIPAPSFAVCDGQKGLLSAIQIHWPQTMVQRCLIHVVRQSLAWITRKPQTIAGQQLRVIVCQLLAIRTRRQKRRWIYQFQKWCRRWNVFLNARTRHPIEPKCWWYTHKKLRRVRTLIVHALPHLFTFVRHPEVPRTSNHVEGGINARLHELFRAHRGFSVSKKRVLTAYFLLSKVSKKSTRNVY